MSVVQFSAFDSKCAMQICILLLSICTKQAIFDISVVFTYRCCDTNAWKSCILNRRWLIMWAWKCRRWMTHHYGSKGVRGVRGHQGRGGSKGIAMTGFIPLSSYLAKGYLVRAICDTGEAPTLIAGRAGSQAASPAAPGTDAGKRVHSSCRINLWTTFKVFI